MRNLAQGFDANPKSNSREPTMALAVPLVWGIRDRIELPLRTLDECFYTASYMWWSSASLRFHYLNRLLPWSYSEGASGAGCV
jgi:hypothetical protein